MTPDFVVDLIRQNLLATFWLAAPLLAVGFLAGITVSLLQIVTSMQNVTQRVGNVSGLTHSARGSSVCQ